MARDLTRMMRAERHETDYGEKLDYRLYVPDLALDTRYPLVVFEHGSGERGDDNLAQLRYGVPALFEHVHDVEPAFLLAPQCPRGMRWSNVNGRVRVDAPLPEFPSLPQKLTIELLDELLERHPIDRDRVYATGLSLGGFGCWDLIMRRPDAFAAALLVCGGGDPSQAGRIAHIPQWIFHGDADAVIPVAHSQHMVAALTAAGAAPRYTEYPGVGHDAWTLTYRNAEALEWLFAQRREATQLARN
ncbi:MAG: phospholipase [Gammaproteobacteria bacterium]|nr:MAG: phospholipase [Gammaproteobacteria bacterium]